MPPMQDIAPYELVATRDAARLLGVSIGTVNRWARDGILSPAVSVSGPRGARFFHRADVERLAAKGAA